MIKERCWFSQINFFVQYFPHWINFLLVRYRPHTLIRIIIFHGVRISIPNLELFPNQLLFPQQSCQGRHLVKCIDVHVKDVCASDNMALMQVVESDGAHDVTEDDWRMYVDDRTGGKLRKKEIKNLEDMGVYVKVPKRVAVAEGAKILDVRWVDPSNVKSRCVVKDFATTIRAASSPARLRWKR